MQALSLAKEMLEPLSAWFQKNARILPWRTKQPRDPYRVWVSEIMLQQTRVTAVIGYFERFMAQFPDVESLANAELAQVYKLWEGLGYYSRAKNLHKTANEILHSYGGVFPNDYDSLRKLCGIGDYTAASIASVCFNLPYPAVDGNVLRVATRITGSFLDVVQPQTKKLVRNALIPLYEVAKNRGELTESLMELGATICVPNGKPSCEQCPLKAHCAAYKGNLTTKIPVRATKPAKSHENLTVFLLQSGDKYLVRKRSDNGLLAHLWEFCNCTGHLDEQAAVAFLNGLGIEDLELRLQKSFTHVFTHKVWHMRVYYLTCTRASVCEHYQWKTLGDITLPSAFKKLRKH